MTSPRNTTADPTIAHLVTAASPGGIEAQEAQGAREMLTATTVPTDMGRHPTAVEARAEYEALGFVFGEPVEGDPMFTHATLPEGWGRAGTGHSMHTNIVDERGIERVGIFYKAAFYDRSAHMHIINVGGNVASKHIYGDGPADAVTLPEGLTDAERADARTSAVKYTEDADRHPDIYGDRLPRAWALIKALDEAEA